MTKSANIIRFIITRMMIFLLILTGISTKSDIEDIDICNTNDTKLAPPGTCNKHNGDSLCKDICFDKGSFSNGKCIHTPRGRICRCSSLCSRKR